jgi:hypothetical protein
MEPQMSAALLTVMTIALIAAGAGATFMLASSLPQAVVQSAQDHGRFAGLARDSEDRCVAMRPQAVGHEFTRAVEEWTKRRSS